MSESATVYDGEAAPASLIGSSASLRVSESRSHVDNGVIGLWIFLGSVTMLFAAFTSAFLVRRASVDWMPMDVPGAIWVSTAFLLVSGLTIELSRRGLRRGRLEVARPWRLVTAGLGVCFLVGQLFVWNQLYVQGIYFQSHPHSSFYFMLSAVHAAHVLPGVFALVAIAAGLGTRKKTEEIGSVGPEIVLERTRTLTTMIATYWHFVTFVWLYLLVVLFIL